jgi:hypothetical protein
MKKVMNEDRSAAKSDDGLVCSACGNKERFIEVMAVETHLVNRRKDYIRLLEGVADHYRCWNCGIIIQEQTGD